MIPQPSKFSHLYMQLVLGCLALFSEAVFQTLLKGMRRIAVSAYKLKRQKKDIRPDGCDSVSQFLSEELHSWRWWSSGNMLTLIRDWIWLEWEAATATHLFRELAAGHVECSEREGQQFDLKSIKGHCERLTFPEEDRSTTLVR